MSQKRVLEIYLECFVNNSKKYYEFRLENDTCYIHYGRIGKPGLPAFFSDASDVRAIKRQLESKLKKGYKIERITNVSLGNYSRHNLLDLAMQYITAHNGLIIHQNTEPEPPVLDMSKVVFKTDTVCPIW
jgi:predicted DNA-binding WGR domain protein